MDKIERLLIKARKKSRRILLEICVTEHIPGKEFDVQPRFMDRGIITREEYKTSSMAEARQEVRRLEREYITGPQYQKYVITDEMVMFLQREMDAGATGPDVPEEMIRRADHLLKG